MKASFHNFQNIIKEGIVLGGDDLQRFLLNKQTIKTTKTFIHSLPVEFGNLMIHPRVLLGALFQKWYKSEYGELIQDIKEKLQLKKAEMLIESILSIDEVSLDNISYRTLILSIEEYCHKHHVTNIDANRNSLIRMYIDLENILADKEDNELLELKNGIQDSLDETYINWEVYFHQLKDERAQQITLIEAQLLANFKKAFWAKMEIEYEDNKELYTNNLTTDIKNLVQNSNLNLNDITFDGTLETPVECLCKLLNIDNDNLVDSLRTIMRRLE
jgi:hypothetical protein